MRQAAGVCCLPYLPVCLSEAMSGVLRAVSGLQDTSSKTAQSMHAMLNAQCIAHQFHGTYRALVTAMQLELPGCAALSLADRFV